MSQYFIIYNEEQTQSMNAYRMNVLTKVKRVPDLSSFKQLFPAVPSVAFQTPTEEVELLVGSNFQSWQPKGPEEVNNLCMVTSKFGSGKILTRTDPVIGNGGYILS